MGKRIDPVIVYGEIMGRCPKCQGEYTGTLDTDFQDIDLNCVSCGHGGKYKYFWPDELPKVTLRHCSNGQIVSRPRKKAKKIKKKSDVLPGQLAFEGAL